MSHRRPFCFASLLVSAAALLAPGIALACGAFYASAIEVSPNQKIIVTHREGVETYVFRPHFCGAAKDFGVILPIPSALTANPVLGKSELFDQLDDFSAPREECQPKESVGIGCGSDADKGVDLAAQFPEEKPQVNVVDRGRVGAFEWALLQAVTVNAFTDWLDQNGFPHDSASQAIYQSYVDKQWYFVAFKVSADASAPPEGMKLCGDLGPIQLSFTAASPVVPSRIASLNQSGTRPTWRVYLVAGQQQRVSDQSGYGSYYSSPYFAQTLVEGDLSSRPALAEMAREGERVTVLTVSLPTAGASDDLYFAADSYGYDYRSTKYKDCDAGRGCSAGGMMPTGAWGATLVLLFLASMRRRRRGA
ncbi:MAG: DUF2330 domain-containing protein [Deltaproteobacteria bacterium]|nr:DUF2330 domain-containing protein [Deltaproteobacteria bacterium]